jgi:DNA-binding GntR family transcriptional regulator
MSNFHVKPMYLRVRDDLAQRISIGELRIGQQLPNEVTLAREYQVSGGTMRKALDTLESEQLVSRTQGRGTFVLDPTERPVALLLNRGVAVRLHEVLLTLRVRKQDPSEPPLDPMLESLYQELSGKLLGPAQQEAAE